MVTDLLQTSAVQRLRGILKSRYGKGLTVRYVVDARSIDFDSAGPQVHKGDLQIPIFVRDRFLGLATIPAVSDLQPDTFGPIVDLVKLVLEPTLQKWYLDNQTMEEATDRSVLPEVLHEVAAPEDVSSLAKGAFLISQNPFAIPRWALSIHETLGRWAFLHFSDLGKELKSRMELQALGAVTLLIDDLLMITPAQEKILAEFLENSDPENEPLILIGTTMSLAEVRERGLIRGEILDLLAPFVIELDRLPRQSKQMEEALRMLLDAEAAQVLV